MGANSDWQAPAEPNPHRKRRWGLVIALIAMTAVIITSAALFLPRLLDNSHAQASKPNISIPGEVLLPSLAAKPETGWRVNLATLIPSIQAPFEARLFSYVGEKAYFKVGGMDPNRRWVVGIDATTGTPLFAPAEISDYGQADCYTNGPHRIVCLNSLADGNSDATDDRAEVWVFDAETGALVNRSPTDLLSDAWRTTPVGDYLVASKIGVGWYGIGDQGQTTWLVSGSGRTPTAVNKLYFPGNPVVNIATDNDHDAVAFSAVDGKNVTPGAKGWIEPIMGGFVVMGRESPSHVYFYNDRGEQTGEYQPEAGVSAEIASGNGQRTVVTLGDLSSNAAKQLVFDAQGSLIAELKSHSLGDSIRFVGDDMYAGPDDVLEPTAVWNKYDLKRGVSISACTGIPLGRGNFVGSDGKVILGFVQAPGDLSGGVLTAVDSDTCTRLWDMPNKPTTVWTVGSTLIQALDQSGEISALVQPTG